MMRELAPEIYRQRLVEGPFGAPVVEEDVKIYPKELGSLTDMWVIADPVSSRSPLSGWAGWVHWGTSGAHFFAWDMPRPFLNEDNYTCKAFDPAAVTGFSRQHFHVSDVVSYGL